MKGWSGVGATIGCRARARPGAEPTCGTWQVNQPLGDPWPWPLHGNEDVPQGLEGPQGNQLGDNFHWRVPGRETETWATDPALSPSCWVFSGKSLNLSGLSFPSYKMRQFDHRQFPRFCELGSDLMQDSMLTPSEMQEKWPMSPWAAWEGQGGSQRGLSVYG